MMDYITKVEEVIGRRDRGETNKQVITVELEGRDAYLFEYIMIHCDDGKESKDINLIFKMGMTAKMEILSKIIRKRKESRNG
jgi:hypothetical protein